MQYTICGQLLNLNASVQIALIGLMRLFQSARRFAHNRLIEGMDRKELVPLLQQKFIPNARYCQWAVGKVEEGIASQRALLPLYVQDLETKIAQSEAKLAKARSEKRRRGILARIEKLEGQRDEYQRHIDADTIPTIVFGGKRNFRLLCQGKLSREKWRELRSNAFYSRGQANQHGPNGQPGNANTELCHRDDNLFDLAVRIPTGQGRGKDQWLTGLTVYVPDHNVSLLANWLSSGQAYSVEVRRQDGQFYCHITLNLPEIKVDRVQGGIAGIDVNPMGIAVTIIYPDGNYQVSRWFPCPALVNVSADKRDWLIGNLVRDAIRWAKSQGALVAVELLKFKQTHDTGRRFNRITHAFTHRKMIETIHTCCWKEELEVKAVNAAFTSIIGRVKYAETYGLSDHQAAALVIARRALSFKERVPRALTQVVFGTQDTRSSWKAWGRVAKWLASVRRHATRNGLNPNTWSLSDYVQYQAIE